MANIDNLNFEIILDDSEFDTKVKKDIESAKNLNVQLSKYLDVRSKLRSKSSGLSAKEAAERKRAIDLNTKEAVSQEKVRLAKTKTAAAQARLNQILKEGNIEQRKHVSLMSQLAPLAAVYYLNDAESLKRWPELWKQWADRYSALQMLPIIEAAVSATREGRLNISAVVDGLRKPSANEKKS